MFKVPYIYGMTKIIETEEEAQIVTDELINAYFLVTFCNKWQKFFIFSTKRQTLPVEVFSQELVSSQKFSYSLSTTDLSQSSVFIIKYMTLDDIQQDLPFLRILISHLYCCIYCSKTIVFQIVRFEAWIQCFTLQELTFLNIIFVVQYI